jgi:hypothetical protein
MFHHILKKEKMKHSNLFFVPVGPYILPFFELFALLRLLSFFYFPANMLLSVFLLLRWE